MATVGCFGKTKEGREIKRFALTNKNNVTVRIIELGGTITEIIVPDKTGRLEDITLGFDDVEGYIQNPLYIGTLIGRVANRIAKGQFELNGQIYHLPINNGPNTNHGGNQGFDKIMWSGKLHDGKVEMTYVSRDGEEGFPGELTTTVTFELTDNDELVLHFDASTTKDTPVNLTNHSYFNLAGQGSPDLKGHMVTIMADSYLPVDETTVPTGTIASVEGTVMDLRHNVDLFQRLGDVDDGRGFDNTFCVSPSGQQPVARMEHPESGRYMELRTTQPSVHFYNSYYLNNCNGKGGAIYRSLSAFCLEAQHYPDSVHHENFPNTILKAGEKFHQVINYKFGVLS